MTDRARAVVIGGGVTGCSVAYHLAKAGWSDVLLLDKGELTSGSTAHAAGLVTTFNPSPTMMRFRRYSIELYRELGVFETVGSLRFASSPEQLKELQRGVSRAHGIGLDAELVSAAEVSALMPAASPESLFGAVWMPGDGFLDPHGTTHALATAARGLGPGSAPHARHGHRARSRQRGSRSRHRERPGRVRGGGQRGRDVGTARRGDGRRVHPLDAGRSPARGAAGGRRQRAAARHAVFPRSRQSGVRQVGARRDPVRRLRGRPPRSLDRRRAVGARLALAAARPGAVRTTHARGHQAVPLPGGGRGRRARVPPGRDDARRHPSARPDTRRPRPLRRRGPVPERVRWGGWHRQGDRRVDHGWRNGARSDLVPGVALRARAPRPGLRRRAGEGGLSVLLPPAIPARSGRVGPAEAGLGPAIRGCRTWAASSV